MVKITSAADGEVRAFRSTGEEILPMIAGVTKPVEWTVEIDGSGKVTGLTMNSARAPDGFIECWDEVNDRPDIMPVWLPPGETAETLGLKTFVPADDGIRDDFDEFDFVDGETDEACP